MPLKKASLISSSEAEFVGFSQSDSATVLSGSKVKAVPSPLSTTAPPSLARDTEERKVALDARCSLGKQKPSGQTPYRNRVLNVLKSWSLLTLNDIILLLVLGLNLRKKGMPESPAGKPSGLVCQTTCGQFQHHTLSYISLRTAAECRITMSVDKVLWRLLIGQLH